MSSSSLSLAIVDAEPNVRVDPAHPTMIGTKAEARQSIGVRPDAVRPVAVQIGDGVETTHGSASSTSERGLLRVGRTRTRRDACGADGEG